MTNYSISPTLNKSRVFILQKSELEKRFDPFYYVPELLELEKKVLAKKPKKLRDYVKGLAKGQLAYFYETYIVRMSACDKNRRLPQTVIPTNSKTFNLNSNV